MKVNEWLFRYQGFMFKVRVKHATRATLMTQEEMTYALNSGNWFRCLPPEDEDHFSPEETDSKTLFDQLWDLNPTYKEDGLQEDFFVQRLAEASKYRFQINHSKIVFIPVHTLVSTSDYPFETKEPPFFGNTTDWLYYAVSLETLTKTIDLLENDTMYIFITHGPPKNANLVAYPVIKNDKRVLAFFNAAGDSELRDWKRP